MIARLPRVLYVELPEGQDWTVSTIDDEQVILVSEALDAADRRDAVKAAYASLRRGLAAIVPAPLIAAGAWIRQRARTPSGAAIMASVLTATAVYAITTTNSEPRPIAEPPAVVTLHPSASMAPPPPTATPTVTSTRPPRTRAASHRSQPTATHPPAPRASRPAQRPSRSTSSRPQPDRSRAAAPRPHPTPTSAPPTAAVPTQAPAREATEEPPAGGTPPTRETPRADVEAEEPTEDPVDDQGDTLADSPEPGGPAETCSGAHLGASVLDPVLDVNVCLFG